MQSLLFNTTKKTIKVTEGNLNDSKVIFEAENVSTVKVLPEGLYEVMQKDENDNARPILRFPISNTNMVIEK
jgi:uncharacterized protein with WD repeat